MSTIHQLNDVALFSGTLASSDVVLGYDTSAGVSVRIGVNKFLQIANGNSSTDSVGFYGATPIVRPSGASQADILSTAATSNSTTQWGYATSTQADGIVTLLRAIRSALNSSSLGLINGA